MWIDDELLRGSLVEILVALRSIVEGDDGCVDDLRDGQTVVQDGLLELPVVLENGSLTGEEAVRLRPSEAEAHAQVSGLGSFVVGTGVLGHIKARNADGAGGAGDGYERIENCCGRFRCVVSMRLCLEADRVDCSVDLGIADNLGNLIFKRDVPGKVDGLIADSFDMREALGIHVSDQNNRGVEDLSRDCSSHADWARASNVDRGSNTTPALIAPWKPVDRMSVSMVRSFIFAMAWALSGNGMRLKSA